MASKSKTTTAFKQADKGDSGSRVSKRSDVAAGLVTAAGASAARAGRAVVVEEEVEDINEQADDFIRRFREQLRLQRLASIENYRQMLARGL